MRIFADDGGYAYDNKFAYAMNRWQHPGDITDEPRASFDGTSGGREISDRFLEDGSYLRIQEVTLSWRLPRTGCSPRADSRMQSSTSRATTCTTSRSTRATIPM